MVIAVPSTTFPMKLMKKVESRGGKAAAAAGSGTTLSRVLVTVTVLGSAGPLRFLVDEGETVSGLIRAALRCYAREGRMPLLRADPAGFLIYTGNGGSDALKADERISFNGCRSFLLLQKATHKDTADEKPGSEPLATTTTSPPKKVSSSGGGWKGLNKFLGLITFKV